MSLTAHSCLARAVLALLAAAAIQLSAGDAAEPLQATLHWQQEAIPGQGAFVMQERSESWDPAQTAIIVCDVWDFHHCLNAVRRLEEFAPRLDALLKVARQQGATIIHAPSDCMAAYADHPARRRATAAPRAANLPQGIGAWCSKIPAEERGTYPIDQSDGGEDDDPAEHAAWAEKLTRLGRNPKRPWQAQLPSIGIDADRDYLSVQGEEIWNVLESRGIKHVILTGVHVNMCVLGRPFGLRQLVRNGKQVVLMRDLTDAMYNPQRWPYVSHFTGNDLIVSHIERDICPTMTSDQILGGRPFRFSQDVRPHVVMAIGEDPYRTAQTLPEFALKLGKEFRVTVLQSTAESPRRIPGLSALADADVLLLSVRRLPLPAADMKLLRDYLAAGKPLVALRTSSHAFSLAQGAPPEGFVEWKEFDAQALGGNYHGSYPDELKSNVEITPGAESQPLLQGVQPLPFIQGGHMYKTGPLRSGASVLLTGKVEGHDPEPVAWTYQRADGGKTFYAALGHPDDFQQPAFVRLLTNAVAWGASKEFPPGATSLVNPAPDWKVVSVPPADFAPVPGGWYRCVVQIPPEWLPAAPQASSATGALTLRAPVRDADSLLHAWINGVPLPPCGHHACSIPFSAISEPGYHLLVLRTSAGAGSLAAPPLLLGPAPDQQLELRGRWQFHPAGAGDAHADSALVNLPLPAQFGGAPDIVFSPEEPLWVARALTRPGEFTPGIEGPACDAEGNVFAVNYARPGTIGRVSPLGAGEVFVNLPAGSIGNGIRFDRQGLCYVADYTGHNVLRIDPATRQVSVFAHNSRMNQPNDLALAPDGTLYASDPNWSASTGQLWRIDADGTTTLLQQSLGTTNGLDVSPDGRTLYVNESVQRNVWAFTIASDKTLADQRLVRHFEDYGFDGMRCDVDGNLYITRHGKGTVIKLTAQGEILQEVNILGARPSNLCFGGPDSRTVYVTEVEFARLVQFRIDRPGRR